MPIPLYVVRIARLSTTQWSTDSYEAIKSVPIIGQAGTAWDNPVTGETVIFVLNEAIWMADKLEHTLVNPNQLRAFGITVQDSPFFDAPIFIATEGNEGVCL
jgi:hypothetical protein